MNELYKALGDISSIRRVVANTTEFRGYGPATLTAAGVQARWVPDPAAHVPAYLAIWISTAVLSAGLTGGQMYTRTRRMHSGLSNEMLRMAVEQFVPAAAAGLLVTLVLVRAVPAAVWMMPGLWLVIFSLGVFSSCRFLPRPMLVAGAWYLLTGLSALAMGGARAMSPWVMGISFGAGQLLVAAILLCSSGSENGEGDEDEA